MTQPYCPGPAKRIEFCLRTTMPLHAAERFRKGLNVAGVFIVDDRASLGHLIDELSLVIECTEQSEWQEIIVYFPLPQS